MKSEADLVATKYYEQLMEEIAMAPRVPYVREPGEVNSYELSNYVDSKKEVLKLMNDWGVGDYEDSSEQLLKYLYKQGWKVVPR